MINDWYNQLEKKVTLTKAEKAEITGAGASAFAKTLKRNTPRSDGSGYSKAGHAKHHKRAHLADSITFKDGYAAGSYTGDTDTGYTDHYFDFLAKIINNGRKRKMSAKEQANMHFWDKSFSQAKTSVTQAMSDKYRQILGDKK